MTEIIWDGKYDKDGRKKAPLCVSLPFQTVETVNESAQQRQKALDFFTSGRNPEWRNRLIWGDKKYVLPSLLPEFAGKVNLIYIDPPFATGADFSYTASIPRFREDRPDNSETEGGGSRVRGNQFVKEASVIEQKAYRDTWGRGLDSYLQWFYETVILLRELLAETGSIYVHLDWHVGHYAKAILDEVFGENKFRNEIVWGYRTGGLSKQKGFPRKHDNILLYSKGSDFIYNPQQERIHYKKPFFTSVEPDEQGRYPVDVYIRDVWDNELKPVINISTERLDYPTQKPEALLERIIKASSNEGDLVLDCFCGSGTTTAVAEKLGRRWIACDLGRFAIHTTRKRLLQIPNVRPFVVQNLGKYERQVWQKAEFGDPRFREETEACILNYHRFILDLYHARPLNGYAWLHGVKNGRMVHVGAVDSPVSASDVTNIAVEFCRAHPRGSGGSGENASPSTREPSNGVDVLGWDFAFELKEIARQQAQRAGIGMRFLRIPREVLEKKAVDQGHICFFELATLSVHPIIQRRTVTLQLTDFMIPGDDVPADVQKAITHWSQWIDYWAVDWDNRSDTFHNEWQSYRTCQSNKLEKQVAHTYEAPDEYTVVVKVIDILGNDTTKKLKVIVI